ncbi:MAG: ParB/RepB/Spo0J family partition protein [Gammaproteobacteria bacterium]|nr:ParB/RepB/Spo0J family partition protein [Gammaproteobacteria bacterium]
MGSQKRLGRGLDVLLGKHEGQTSSNKSASKAYVDMSVGTLVQGQFQPRQTIEDEALAELVQSIQQQGVLQPLLVRALAGSKRGSGVISHEIVAGERRWRAAKLAGLKTVPVAICDLDDKAALAVALIENLQREDLNAIEVAESLLKLTKDFGLTHQQAAEAVGRSRSSVSNYLRLLELGDGARECLATGNMDMGHARALLSLDVEQQDSVAKKIPVQKLSVREVEQLVVKLHAGPDTTVKRKADMQARWLQRQLAKELGVKVGIRTRKDGGNVLGIDFDNLNQLHGTLQKIEKLVGQVIDTAGPRIAELSRQDSIPHDAS